MKRIFIIFILIILSKLFYAQSIGIGTNLPDTNAIIDINSTNKGALLPRMNTAQRNALATITGLTVFDITTNSYWFYDGTVWQEMAGGFTLPYTSTVSTASGSLLSITNSSSGNGIKGESSSGVGLWGASNNGYGVYGSSSSYYGGYFTSSTGSALGVNGKMNINSTTGVTGANLTINCSDNPYWQDPVTFSVKDLGVSNLSVASGTDIKLPFTIEDYDLGNDFVQ